MLRTWGCLVDRALVGAARACHVRTVAGWGLLTVLLTVVVRQFCPWPYPFPDHSLRSRRPSRIYTDRHGGILQAALGDGDQWRIPVPLHQMSPWLVVATVAVEDHRFWEHNGIDWLAVCRALVDDLAQRRIVSGASTLSMQLARIAQPEPRSLGYKLRQACRGLDVDRRRGKEWVLEQYLNHAPYGGNLVGVEAASRFYFRKSARDLSRAEATLLAGLPQGPALLRPDRHPQAAARRHRHVLARLAALGYMSADEVAAVRSAVRLADPPGRSGGDAWNRLGLPMRETHVCQLAQRQLTDASSRVTVRTTLDPVLQRIAREAVTRRVATLQGVQDGAVVIIENRTLAVRALVGTLDFDAPADGQVNGACRPRSPGSALKPFIYAAAIDGGLIVPETVLCDQVLLLSDYRPGNFDGSFAGRVTAREALARSLNTPAVRLLKQLGPERVLAQLRACGLTTLQASAERYGLSLALGGAEVALLDLATAYAGLARGGRFGACQFVENQPPAPGPVREAKPFADGTVALVHDMLSSYQLPGSGRLNLAWKTGTSSGFRDAWCIAYNAEFTVGVWLGNKSGWPDRDLVGATASAPVVVDIMQAIYRDRPPAPLPRAPKHVRELTLCRTSGLRAGPGCRSTIDAVGAVGVPLRPCRMCARPASPPPLTRTPDQYPPPSDRPIPLRIIEPQPGVYVRTRGDVRLRLCTGHDRDCHWFVDGRYVGRKTEPHWHTFDSGHHDILTVCSQSGDTDRVTLDVR